MQKLKVPNGYMLAISHIYEYVICYIYQEPTFQNFCTDYADVSFETQSLTIEVMAIESVLVSRSKISNAQLNSKDV